MPRWVRCPAARLLEGSPTMKRALVLLVAVLAACGAGLGGGYLLWADQPQSRDDGVYAGMNQNEIDRRAVDAINGYIKARVTDASCVERRFELNVFECHPTFEDPSMFALTYIVRFS